MVGGHGALRPRNSGPTVLRILVGSQIRRLREAADFAIYTPGGDAGLPIALLGAFAPPGPLDDAETTRDAVSGTATGLLSLVGIEADPLRSREHILIATLLERAWEARSSAAV